jgi:hypothetical protein
LSKQDIRERLGVFVHGAIFGGGDGRRCCRWQPGTVCGGGIVCGGVADRGARVRVGDVADGGGYDGGDHRAHDSVADYAGLGRVMPWTFAGFAIASASMIGMPPFAGAWAKLWLITAAAGSGLVWAAGWRALRRF